MRLGELEEKMIGSDRVLVVNTAGQTIYRGYIANLHNAGISLSREVKRLGIGVESYKKTEEMWDWKKTDALPEQVPVKSVSQYSTREIETIVFTRIMVEE